MEVIFVSSISSIRSQCPSDLNSRPSDLAEAGGGTKPEELLDRLSPDSNKMTEFEKTEMKYDSTGMFHWTPARSIEDCILVGVIF